MSDKHILVTGDIPHFPEGGPGGAPCDAVDVLARDAGVPFEEVRHLHRPDEVDFRRLQEMPRYVAGVGLRHVERLLPDVTELVVFETPHLRLAPRRHATMLASVLRAAAERNIPTRVFESREQFDHRQYDDLAGRTA